MPGKQKDVLGVTLAAVFAMLAVLPAQAQPTVKSGFVGVTGGQIWYESRGTGPSIVMLHDGLLDSQSWDSVAVRLSQDFHVVRYDRRGYGRSAPPTKMYDITDDLAELMDSLGIESAALVGSSMGGSIAITFALKYPGRVTGMVLAGPVVGGFPYSKHFVDRNQRISQPLAENGDVATTIERWVADPYLVWSGNVHAKSHLRDLLVSRPKNLSQRFDLVIRSSTPPVRRLEEIKSPTLLLVGEHDIPDVHAQSGAIERAVYGSQRVVVEHAGHLLQIERPGALSELVKQFLQKR